MLNVKDETKTIDTDNQTTIMTQTLLILNPSKFQAQTPLKQIKTRKKTHRTKKIILELKLNRMK